jgi:nicotinate-nucleotide pyrophosphorylase (carboxylating)
VVLPALEEDRGAGDVTSRVAVPEGAPARARLVAKEAGVLAGLDVFARVFELCDPGAEVRLAAADGDVVEPGREVAVVEGGARALLLAERTALNLLQRLSGCATKTARCVALLRDLPGPGGRGVRLLDTRKTTPGLRALEKYAVRCGGGENHRFGLFDEVLLKENHMALAGRPMEQVLGELRAQVGPGVRITAEARDLEEARAAVRGGADVVLLDNMSPEAMGSACEDLRALARELGRELELEASGGVSEDNLRAVAASGVDRVSIGALTHSVAALDLSLSVEPLP